jgi:hypothetical protein
MTRPKQHHFVTRAYLQEFVPLGESHLYVYMRNKPKYFRAAPEKLARIHNYYSIRQKDGTLDDRLETLLEENIERPGLAVLRRLNAGHYGISADARARLAHLMAIQEYRVPWMRENMEESYGAMLEKTFSVWLRAPGLIEQQIEELTEKGEIQKGICAEELRKNFFSGAIKVVANPSSSLRTMWDMSDVLTECYFRMKWTVLESTSERFITSDCPVHRYYLPVNPKVPFSGFADPRVHVRFPLSSRKFLVLGHDFRKIELHKKLLKRGLYRKAELLKNRASEIKQVCVGDADVQAINAHTVSMAAKLIFSPREIPDLAVAFRGECLNMRQVVTELPGGLIAISDIYPKR